MDGIAELARMLGKEPEERTQRASATVTRITGDGTVWCSIPGGAGEFPVTHSTIEVSVGDTVTVTIENGRATIDGSTSAPSISAAKANELLQPIAESASTARAMAGAAAAAAESAQESADQAAGAASDAQGSADAAATAASIADGKAVAAGLAADAAQGSADAASTAANSALGQLGVVQDVVGVLDYVAQHGGFVLTQDQSIQEGKVYFTYDSTTGDYSPVIDPQASALSTYYEVSEDYDDVMGDFIMAHLAVTSRGLWVLPSGVGSSTTPASGESQADSDARQGGGYKVLLSSGGMYIYDGSGNLVRSDLPSGTNFASGRDWHMGGNDAYISYDASEGTITIGGSSINLGDSRTLSELLGEVDNTIVFKVTEEYSQDESSVTLTAHVYRGGEDTASQYPDSCFAWYRKNEDGSPRIPLGDSPTITVQRSSVGYGAAIACSFTEPNDSVLLDSDDDALTDSEGTPLAVRTPSGDYVRVADLEATTTVFDTDKLMLVGAEEEQLVSIATLKDVFGDGDYERLDNMPSIEDVTLVGNKTFPDLGIFKTDSQGYSVADDYTLTTLDINALWANAQPIGA